MKNNTSFHRALFLLIALAAACALVAEEISEERVTMKRMVGKVEVRAKNSPKWREGRVGMLLKSGWDVRTYLESEAEVEFETGTVIKIGENAAVTLSALMKNSSIGATRSKVAVASGEVWGNVKKLVDNRSRFVFETPTATAAIRGTRLGLAVDQGQTRLDVYEGHVMFEPRGSNRPVSVVSNTRAIARRGETEVEMMRMSAATATDSTGDTTGAAAADFVDPFAAAAPDTGDTAGVPPADTTAEEEDEDTTDTPRGLNLEILYPPDGHVSNEEQTVITGQAVSGAVAYVENEEAAVGSDGLFSAVVTLAPGANTIRVSAAIGANVIDRSITIQYQLPLVLEVKNATDGMEVLSSSFELDIEVTEGASFSVNGVEGETMLELRSGRNTVVVKAWDTYGNTAEQTLTIIYRTDIDAALHVSLPQEGAVIDKPEISVAGTATPGATVAVNGIEVPVAANGAFHYQVLLPDEPGEFVIAVSAEIGEKELNVERTVVYTPPKQPLSLTVTSPASGQTIKRRVISVSGKTGTHATVTANNKPIRVSANGLFNGEIMLAESDIGEYEIEFLATEEDEELTKTINVVVDVTSAQVNTSVPTVQFQGRIAKATRNGTVSVSATDRTPEDNITIVWVNNGTREEYTVESSETVTINLEEGKNSYAVYGYDRAGNISGTLQGVVYYLPGPIEIELLEPSDNPCVIKGLPPLPGNVDAPRLELEVDIDDGVDNVPETIQYCRVRGMGQDVLLHNNNDYTFEGSVTLTRGVTNTFIIHVEDLAGTVQTKTISVQFSR